MQPPLLLSFAIWIPVAAGLFALFTGSDRAPGWTRWVSLVGAVLGVLPTIPLLSGFDKTNTAMQFVENAPLVPAFGISWHLGVDGISLWFVVLTAVTTLIIVISSWRSVSSRLATWFGSFLLLSGFMQGVFTSLDGILFFQFFEATLIPLFLLIGGWGREHRSYAAMKFFLISLAGSLAMLLAMIYLYTQSHSFDIAGWRNLNLGFWPQIFVFLGFLAAFSVKVPMWPVHTWLPDVHLEGPTAAAVLIGMLKMGGYGLLRFSLPITPDASHFVAPAMITLSLVAIIYASAVALVQSDMRKLLAYSAVAHMGLVTLGLFTFNRIGTEGAIVQMLTYGIVSGAMLLCTGMLVDRTGNGAIDAYGGVASTMPRLATFVMLFSMANVGLPGTAGFVGEFMVLMGALRFNFWVGGAAALTLILSAGYTLWMVKRVMFGGITNGSVANLVDLSRREFAVLGALAVLVLAIGIRPKPFTDAIDPSTGALLSLSLRSEIADTPSPAMPTARPRH